MALYNQEHRDYGAHRKYPFTDDSSLSVSGGDALPDGLVVDAVLHVDTKDEADTEVWLEVLDLGSRTVRIRTASGMLLSGDIDGTEVKLTAAESLQASGLLLLGRPALDSAGRARYVMTPRAAVFNPSCVFLLTTPGVTSLNGRSGHISLTGVDGVSVFTGVVDGKNVLRVDAVGVPKSYVDCDFVGREVLCTRWVHERGSLISADTTNNGDVVLGGVSTFTGEALCESRAVAQATTHEDAWYLAPRYSPESWQGSQLIKDEMADMGWWWAIADKHVADAGTLELYPLTGGVYSLVFNGLLGFEDTVVTVGPAAEYGYPYGHGLLRPLYVRNFSVYDLETGTRYEPVCSPTSERPVVNSINNDGGYYLVSTPAYNEAGTRVWVAAPPDGYILPFAALLPIRSAAPDQPVWEPTAAGYTTEVCARYGRINIYTPNHEDGSNPLRSDRDKAMLGLRGYE